jgi:hypothetical protein
MAKGLKKKQTPDERLELSTLGLKGPRANQLCLLSLLEIVGFEWAGESYQPGMYDAFMPKIAYFNTYAKLGK